jgi:hypothetical protein
LVLKASEKPQLGATQLIRVSVAVAVTCVVGFVGCRSGRVAPDASAPTTLCAIGRENGAFTGKTVTVSADAITDMRHLTLLVDQACADQAIALQFPENTEDPSIGEFRAVLFAGDPVAKPNRKVSALFTGTVSLWPGRVPSRILILKRVGNLKVAE